MLVLYRKFKDKFAPFMISTKQGDYSDEKILRFNDLRTSIQIKEKLVRYDAKEFVGLANLLARMFKEVFDDTIYAYINSRYYEYEIDWYNAKVSRLPQEQTETEKPKRKKTYKRKRKRRLTEQGR